MKKHIFKAMSMLLVVVMLVGMMAVTAFAADCTGATSPDGNHKWYQGVCQYCNTPCEHTAGYTLQNNKDYCKCNTCGIIVKHSFDTTNLSNAQVVTCNTGTYKVFCDLGCGHHTFTTTNTPVAHDFGADGKCTRANCTEVDPNYTGPCTNHVFGTDGKCKTNGCKATCTHTWTKFDSTTHKCTVCGMPQSHTIEEKHSCQTTYFTKWCAVCKSNVTNPVDTGVKGDHNFNAEGTCTVCGAKKNCEELTPPKAHTWDTTNHNCSVCKVDCPHPTNKRTTVYNCKSTYKTTVCGDCTKSLAFTNEGVKGPHNYVNGTCTICGAKKNCEELTPPKAHQWNKVTHECDVCKTACPHKKYETVAPNCKSEYEVERCEDCWYVKSRTDVGLGDHIYENGVCTLCGAPEVCPGHEWNWTNGQCKICKIFHDPHNFKPVDFDCTVGGRKTDKCTVCGYTHVWNTPYEPTKHTYEDGVCTVCGHVCEHKETSTTVTATCVKAGKEIETCKECEMVLSTKTVKALGHNYKNGVCTRCGDIEKKVVIGGLDNVPKTGDASVVILSVVAVAALFVTAGFTFSKKKRVQ